MNQSHFSAQLRSMSDTPSDVQEQGTEAAVDTSSEAAANFAERYSDVLGKVNTALDQVDWENASRRNARLRAALPEDDIGLADRTTPRYSPRAPCSDHNASIASSRSVACRRRRTATSATARSRRASVPA